MSHYDFQQTKNKSHLNTSKLATSQYKPVKKFEGYDNESYVDRTTGNFTKKIDNFKAKTADESIEAEYIKGLQDEIKYLEYELKLLKDKEIEQAANLSQLDQFFSDGVAINENILGMKNLYLVTKQDMDIKYDKAKNEEAEKIRINTLLKEFIERLNRKLVDNEGIFLRDKAEDMKEINVYFTNKKRVEELTSELNWLKDRLKELQKSNREKKRIAERKAVLTMHSKETKEQTMKKLKKNIDVVEKEIIELEKKLEELKGNESINPHIQHLLEENSELKVKVSEKERKINLANNKVIEANVVLEQRAREREQEAELKRDLESKIENLKLHIKKENEINEAILEQKVKEKEIADIKEIEKQKHRALQENTLYQNRLDNIEDTKNKLLLAKADLDEIFVDEESKREDYEKAVPELFEDISKKQGDREQLILQLRDLTAYIDSIVNHNKKKMDQVPKLEEENKHLKSQIDLIKRKVKSLLNL